jgi:hypothetical protein
MAHALGSSSESELDRLKYSEECRTRANENTKDEPLPSHLNQGRYKSIRPAPCLGVPLLKDLPDYCQLFLTLLSRHCTGAAESYDTF